MFLFHVQNRIFNNFFHQVYQLALYMNSARMYICHCKIFARNYFNSGTTCKQIWISFIFWNFFFFFVGSSLYYHNDSPFYGRIFESSFVSLSYSFIRLSIWRSNDFFILLLLYFQCITLSQHLWHTLVCVCVSTAEINLHLKILLGNCRLFGFQCMRNMLHFCLNIHVALHVANKIGVFFNIGGTTTFKTGISLC